MSDVFIHDLHKEVNWEIDIRYAWEGEISEPVSASMTAVLRWKTKYFILKIWKILFCKVIIWSQEIEFKLIRAILKTHVTCFLEEKNILQI